MLADQRGQLIADGADVLHVAVDPILRDRIRPRCRRYVTLDLFHPADVQEPLERTSFPDASFDHVICCHVLEHVDDRRALREVFRVLRPKGTMLVMVPVVEGWDATYENAAVESPRERELHFGQGDHVRYYGRDLRARIRDAGFQLSEATAEGPDVVTFGLLRGEKLFIASKPARGAP